MSAGAPGSGLEERLARLEAFHEVRQLKARYCSLADQQRWDEFVELFTDDCTFDTGTTDIGPIDGGLGSNTPPNAGFVIDDRHAFVDTLKVRLKGARSVHQIHEPELELREDGSVIASWPIYDLVLRPSGAEIPSWRGHGYYNEEYRETEDGWRICRLKVVRLRMDIVEIDD